MVTLSYRVHDPHKTNYAAGEPRSQEFVVGEDFADETAAQAKAVELHEQLKKADPSKNYTFAISASRAAATSPPPVPRSKKSST